MLSTLAHGDNARAVDARVVDDLARTQRITGATDRVASELGLPPEGRQEIHRFCQVHVSLEISRNFIY